MKAFENWWYKYTYDWRSDYKDEHRPTAEHAYKAGMLRAAEIAEQGFESASADGKHIYNYNAGRCDAANAIRKGVAIESEFRLEG